MAKTIAAADINEEQIQMIYEWIDEIPFSRPKRNITRDFSDAVMTVEIIKHYIPALINLHSFPAANSIDKKRYNWTSLNERVFKKMGFVLTSNDIQNVIACVPDTVEKVLFLLKQQIEEFLSRKKGLVRADSRRKPVAVKIGVEGVPDPNTQPLPDPVQVYDEVIEELRDTVDILKLKVEKLELLGQMKDEKVRRLEEALAEAGIM